MKEVLYIVLFVYDFVFIKDKFVKCVDVEVVFGYLLELMCDFFMGVYVFVEVNIDE